MSLGGGVQIDDRQMRRRSHRQCPNGGGGGGSSFKWPSSSRVQSPSSCLHFSLITLIATTLVISLVIGRQIQPADGQSTAASGGGSGGLSLSTTPASGGTSSSPPSSSSLGSRGLKRASQQQQRPQQQVATLDQQQPLDGMAPFFSIKDGKTSARRIQQQQQQQPAGFVLQRNNSASRANGGGQFQRQEDEQINQNTDEQVDQQQQQQTALGNSNELMGANLNEQLNGNRGAQELDLNEPLNQLAPMNNGDEQQQQLTNAVGSSFNQLAMSSADRLNGGDSKPELGGGGGGGGDLAPPQDDAGRQQNSLATTTATAAAAGDETEDADVKRRIQSTGGSEPLASGGRAELKRTGSGGASRLQPAPIKQSSNRADVIKTTSATKSAQQRNRQQQQQQQQASSGPASSGQLQQASSLSMSLDGMIVNSRPRASTTATSSNNVNFEQQFRSGVKSNQRAAGALNRNTGTGANFNKAIGQQSGRVQQPLQQQRAGGDRQQTNAIANANANVKLTSGPPPPTSTTTMRSVGSGESTTSSAFPVQVGGQQRQLSASSTPSAGSSRRVPFSGIPFSSPASKGQRTKPKASNQFGGFSSTTTSNSFDLNQTPINQAPQRQQFNSQDDQQQKMALVTLDGEQQLKVNEELMNSVMASLSSINDNGGQSGDINSPQARFNQVSTSKLANGDMLMSVISSEDGRERKLVMMSRDTLDNLQKFADQQLQREQEPQLQQVAEPSNDQTPTEAGLFGMPASSTTASEFEQQTTPANNNRQLQTTTTPVSFSTSIATTTQTPVEQTGSGDGFGPVAQTTSTTTTTGTGATLTVTGGTNEDSSEKTGNGTSADTFREVSVQQADFSGNNNEAGGLNQRAGEGQTETIQQGGNTNGPVKQKSADNSGTKLTKLNNKQVVAAAGGVSSTQTLSLNERQTERSRQQATPTPRALQVSTDFSTTIATSTASNDESSGTPIKPKSGGQTGTKSKTRKIKQQQKSSVLSNGPIVNGLATNSSAALNATKRAKTNKTQKSGAIGVNQKQQNKTGQVGRKQSSATSASLPSAQVDRQQQSFTSTTQSPAMTLVTTVTNGQQLAKGRLGSATATLGGLNQDTIKPLDEFTTQMNRDSNVETLETNRRQNDGSVTVQQTNRAKSPQESGLTNSGANFASNRNELDRQLDQMERANAADANNQAAAAELDDDRSRALGRVGAGDGRAPSMSELDGLRAAIPGEPLVDYPIYAEPPNMSSRGSSAGSFQCQAQSCPGGYYADPDAQCQVFHVCQQDGRMDTFLCPNGTIFSQQHFVCVWWWQVDCSQTRSLYKLNDAIYCNSMNLPPTPIGGEINEDPIGVPANGNGEQALVRGQESSRLSKVGPTST